jgi:hypothetical protein
MHASIYLVPHYCGFQAATAVTCGTSSVTRITRFRDSEMLSATSEGYDTRYAMLENLSLILRKQDQMDFTQTEMGRR